MTNKSKAEKLRIIIHGCGNVGQRVTRFCDLKGWEIVAAYNRAGDKVGQDLGRLAGLDKDIGVIVEDVDRIELSRKAADITVMATTTSDLLEPIYSACEKYLSLGINVIVHGSQSHNPFFDDPDVAVKIERIARANQVTFSGSTIWDSTRIWSGILVAGNCVKIESLVHTATGEPGRQNPLYEAGVGIGMTVEDFTAKYADDPHPLQKFLHGPPVMVLQHLGCTISNVQKHCEPIVLEMPMYSPHTKREYPAGVIGGVRVVVEVDTEEGIKGLAQVEYRLFQEGEEELMHWKAIGLPGMEISVNREDAANLSAASIFNRIPDVIAARPGIVEIFSKEMGPMSSTALL